jgi:hypothetical protein
MALRQILQERFGLAAIDSANPTLSEREAGHAGGRIQEVATLRDEIMAYCQGPGKGTPGG